ncbi:hypothetical protein CWS02_11370 [Enterobacter sp. EA-1]|nr:hypothetical protein CWS02_11370 [Enterobacter sp. EA-1]
MFSKYVKVRPSLGSSRFPPPGNVRVNILVAKRGTYGLNIISQARPLAHQLLFTGGSGVLYGTPVWTLL